MTGSLIESYIGASEDKLSGELADRDNIVIGSFKVGLMDNIFNMTEEKLCSYVVMEG